MFNMEKFARLLSGRRREKGLTQDQLADLVGVTHQAVSKWERAEALPEMSKIGDIAKAVDTPTEELISSLYGGETEKVNNAEEPNGNADAEYFALEDKTRVGDIYAIA
ncbi:MAG: helix-turn-helix transcriptional regulator, partial [Clostridia bacterium]|nr:helix-turn-helix transcriptional regulator [Clostridia bacterium]